MHITIPSSPTSVLKAINEDVSYMATNCALLVLPILRKLVSDLNDFTDKMFFLLFPS